MHALQWAAWWLAAGCAPVADPAVAVAVVRSPGPPPAWLDGPIDFASPAGRGRAQHALCRDLGGARQALLDALADDARWGAVAEAQLWDDACEDPAWIGWLRSALSEPDPLGQRGLLWSALVAVDDAAIGASVVAEAPPPIVVFWLANHGREVPARAVPMIGRLLREDPDLALVGIDWLATVDGPDAERALVTLHEHAPEALRDEIAASLYGRTSEPARALHAEVCARTGDPRCGLERPGPLAALEACVAGDCSGVDVAAVLRRNPAYRGAVADLLAQCVADDGPSRRMCAGSLVEVDPARASTVIPDGDDALADLRADLDRAPADRAAGLVALGFADVSGEPSVLPALAAAGWAVPVPDRPVAADRLMYTLADAIAATGSPALSGVAFDVVPISASAPLVAGRRPRPALWAYADGWRLRTLLDEDGVDVEAVAGLTNAVLAARGVDRRVAIDVDHRYFVIGSPDGLLGLARDGWVRFATFAADDAPEAPAMDPLPPE